MNLKFDLVFKCKWWTYNMPKLMRGRKQHHLSKSRVIKFGQGRSSSTVWFDLMMVGMKCAIDLCWISYWRYTLFIYGVRHPSLQLSWKTLFLVQIVCASLLLKCATLLFVCFPTHEGKNETLPEIIIYECKYCATIM